MAVISDIVGMDEIIAKLNKLPTRLAGNAMRRSLRKGANVIRDAAKANAKRIDDPGTREAIYKNIAVYGGGRRRERRAGGPMMRVGVRGGARSYSNTRANVRKGRVGKSYATGGNSGNPGGDTWYWRLIEFGFHARDGSAVAPRPFMRPAMNENIGAAFDAIAADMPKQIDKELAKL